MSKKGTKVEELIELLKDEKATEFMIDKLGDSWSPAIEIMLEKKIDKIIDRILLKLDPIIEKKINNLIGTQLDSIQLKQTNLEKENSNLLSRLSQLESEARLPNLVFHGVEEAPVPNASRDAAEKEAIQATLNLCTHTLGLLVTEADISTAYRLPRKGKEKFRPIIAKFNTIRIRNLVYRSRTQLRKTSIFVNEHLSPVNAQIYARARTLVREGKASSSWTTGGSVFLMLSEGQDQKPIKIISLSVLLKLIPSPSPASDVSPTLLKIAEVSASSSSSHVK